MLEGLLSLRNVPNCKSFPLEQVSGHGMEVCSMMYTHSQSEILILLSPLLSIMVLGMYIHLQWKVAI